jgi:hypothetical protein
MCEKVCQICTKFIADQRGMPDGVKQLSRNALYNKDGSEKTDISPLALIFAMQTSGLVDYGHRGCESPASATIASSGCIHPESFEQK